MLRIYLKGFKKLLRFTRKLEDTNCDLKFIKESNLALIVAEILFEKRLFFVK
jgi:hypothetical protein